jgi:hypothetical protein
VTGPEGDGDVPAVTIARGLTAKPAYLLVFGISFLFATGSGAGFAVGLTNSAPFISVTSGVVFTIALISCLLTAYKSITLGERSEQGVLAQGDLKPEISPADGRQPSSAEETDEGITVAFPASLNSDFVRSTETLLMGIHQSHILIRYYDIIQEKLRRGCQIRILLLDPRCAPGIHMTAMRFPGVALDTQEEARVESSLSNYRAIQQQYPELLEIRGISFLLPYGGFLFDWSAEDATVYIQRYTFRVQGGSRKPKFFHKGAGSPWLQLYKTEMLAMWDAAEPLSGEA